MALVNRPMIDDKLFSGLYQEVCKDNKDIQSGSDPHSYIYLAQICLQSTSLSKDKLNQIPPA